MRTRIFEKDAESEGCHQPPRACLHEVQCMRGAKALIDQPVHPQSDQGLRCTLTESLYVADYINVFWHMRETGSGAGTGKRELFFKLLVVAVVER